MSLLVITSYHNAIFSDAVGSLHISCIVVLREIKTFWFSQEAIKVIDTDGTCDNQLVFYNYIVGLFTIRVSTIHKMV